ncbi:MAG: PQQ-dependent sugar dehydrogenase [Woeseiaceae bacterium]|nr:PQQ-dependent sugar dehydrogenase [Woeseiaceae bacterium]
MQIPFAWRITRFRSLAALGAAAALVSACGGGGGGASPPPPGPPPPPPPPASPSITIADSSVTEGDSGAVTIDFAVVLSATSANAISVDYATSDGTAEAATDYDAASGTLDFPAGTTNQMISVTVNGDSDVESGETFTMTLSNPSNATLANATATGTILNDDVVAGVFGLDARPDNMTCIAPARPNIDATVTVVDAFPGLANIPQPTKMLLEPVANPRWFVLQKTGQIVTFDPDNAVTPDLYLDLTVDHSIRTNSEGGLLGMAFHPNYPATPEIFLSYTIDHTGPAMRSVISRYTLDNVTTPGAGTTEEVIIEIDQDFNNHNGGDIAFGPDGYLYIGLGDGGSGGDPNNRAQDTRYLLGSMLRIDVSTSPYDIPSDNPFSNENRCGPGFNTQNCPEIYAWGLRNPWRWSFDPDSGELWLADVGQNAYEEVNLIELGGNYGWRCREGANDFNMNGCTTGYIDPVTEYDHGQGNSITGGYVYRGSAIPELRGRYVFADYGSGRIWAVEPDGQGGYTNDELIDTSFGPTSFGVDQDGELYFTDINNSRLRKIEPAGAPTPDTIPDLLSDTGCVDPTDVTAPYAGLLPYDLNAPFWSDGAVKDRHIGLPNGETITRDVDGDYEFPNGTVIVKNFRLNGDLIETRHLMRHPDGVWAGYTYEWNAQQTEATRVRGGKTVNINGQDWIYPSEGQCLECHTSAAGFALGPEDAQFNKTFTYPATGRTANQIETINHVLMYSAPVTTPVDQLPALADPSDSGASLDDRARAYLHTNCAQCHQPGAPTPTTMDLRYSTPLANTNACNEAPLLGDIGVANALLIAPGEANRSLVIERASRRDIHGMPPVGSTVLDTAGIGLLTAWINSLGSCN